MRGPSFPTKPPPTLPWPTAATTGPAPLSTDPALHSLSRTAASTEAGLKGFNQQANEGGPRVWIKLPKLQLDSEGRPLPLKDNVTLRSLAPAAAGPAPTAGGPPDLQVRPWSPTPRSFPGHGFVLPASARPEDVPVLPPASQQTTGKRKDRDAVVDLQPAPASQQEVATVKRRRIGWSKAGPARSAFGAAPVAQGEGLAGYGLIRSSNALIFRLHQRLQAMRIENPTVTAGQAVMEWFKATGSRDRPRLVLSLIEQVEALDQSLSGTSPLQIIKEDTALKTIRPRLVAAVASEIQARGLDPSKPSDIVTVFDAAGVSAWVDKNMVASMRGMLTTNPLTHTSEFNADMVLQKISQNDRAGAVALLTQAGYSKPTDWLSHLRQKYKPKVPTVEVPPSVRSAILEQEGNVPLEFLVQNNISLAQANEIVADDKARIGRVSAQLESGTPITALDLRGVRKGSEERVTLEAQRLLIKDDAIDVAILKGGNLAHTGKDHTQELDALYRLMQARHAAGLPAQAGIVVRAHGVIVEKSIKYKIYKLNRKLGLSF